MAVGLIYGHTPDNPVETGIVMVLNITAMKKTFQLLALALTLIYGCTKEALPPESSIKYLNLEVGNCWYYELFRCDANGVYASMHMTDSNYVEKDTVINGLIYLKYIRTGIGTDEQLAHFPVFVRDSSGMLVNQEGHILFSTHNFSDTLYRRHYFREPGGASIVVTGKMTDPNLPVSVPAGTFITQNFQLKEYYHDNSYGPLLANNRYAEGVGLIERNLCSYPDKPGVGYSVLRLTGYRSN